MEYLHGRDGLEVLYTANSGLELLSLLKKNEAPQVLLLDLRMDGMDGIEVTEHLKVNYPDIRVVVVSSHYQRSFMGFMLKTGVAAFLPKGISPPELIEVIKTVHRQGYYFKDDQLAAIREQVSAKAPKPVLTDEGSLSERETEILKLICRQKTAKEIGEQLFTTPRTIEGHKNNLFAKTGTKNIAGLVVYAIKHHIITLDELA
jgi:DNA-binding NarL/FixJ family response regulator